MHAWIASLTFLSFILLIVSNSLSPAVVALACTLVLIYGGVFTLSQAAAEMTAAYSTLALLLGAMVVVRTLQPTGIFLRLARLMFIAAKGRGSRLLLGITLTTVALSAMLPNATAVLVLGPVLVPLAEELDLRPEPLLILLALAANSGGLLTMVGDPATYLVSQAADIGFVTYLYHLSWTGIAATLVLIALLPWCWRDIWTRQLPCRAEQVPAKVQLVWHSFLPIIAIGSGMLVFFVAAELLHVPFAPDLVALSGAAAALALAERFKLGSVADVLRDIDWSTLIFFACTFILIGALEQTGVVGSVAGMLAASIHSHPQAAATLLLCGTALLSSVFPNIPLMAALIPLIQAIGPVEEHLMLYSGLLLGGTLGGNATMIGASANMVAVGLARQHGVIILFRSFFRHGLPVCIAQVAVVGILQILIAG